MRFRGLKRKRTRIEGPDPSVLETFPCPPLVNQVVLQSDEFTAVCPVTGQPDLYKVQILTEASRCLESKSLKMYLWGWRNHGAFCEQIAARIAHHVGCALAPGAKVTVGITQKSRGGIVIQARAQTKECP